MAGNPRIDDLRKRLEKEPSSRLFAQLAEELRKEGDFEEAIRVSRQGLARHPSYPSARMTLGRALFDTGDVAAARAEFESVLKGAPDNILASRLLAECLESLGELEGALARYRSTLALCPGDKHILARVKELEKRLPPPAAPPPVPAPGAEHGEPAMAASVAAPAPEPTQRPVEPQAPPESPPAREPASPPEPTPIPLVAVEEDFEIEAAYDSPGTHWRGSAAEVPPPEPAAEPSPQAAPEPSSEAAPEPAPAPHLPPASAQADLSSPTLAELYFKQGFPEKAAEVYRRLLEREPGNEQARARLAELEWPGGAAPPEPARVPEPAPADPGAARREALERTISRLESFRSALGKGSR